MGGTHSHSMCILAIKIWQLCVDNGIWLKATHIPGVNNIEADRLSRSLETHDYSLSQSAFDDLVSYLNFRPEVDLFASQNTKKLRRYVTKSFDPFAWKVDAFSFKWERALYMFPPLCMISATVEKFIRDCVPEGVLITPFWLGLPCVASLFNLLIRDPILIPAVCIEGARPTRYEFSLVAWHISCLPVRKQAFQNQRQKHSWEVSAQRRSSSTIASGGNLQPGWEKAGIHLQLLYP